LLTFFERLTARLSFLRPACLLAALAGLALLLLSLFGKNSESLLMPGLLLLIWSLLSFSFLTLFGSLPAQPAANQGFFSRLKARFLRLIYWLLALLFVLLTLGILGMTLRGLFISLSG